jgi:tetrahydromethanopterin:alpha-L-glutamate ligase
MKTLAALVSGLGWHVADLRRAAGRLDVVLHAVPFAGVSASVPEPGDSAGVRADAIDLMDVDGVLVRMMPPGSLEQVVFRMDALHRVAAAGVPVLNPPRAIEAAVDKYLTLALLSQAGLPVPATWAGQSAAGAFEAFDELGGDVVVKPLFGSEGRGLVRVGDRELAWRMFHALERIGSVLYLQRAVRHPGHDLRLFVLNGAVLGAMRRHAPPGDWRTNVSLGGRAEPHRPSADEERLAITAARAVGADMAGVDLIVDCDRDRPVVLEVNAVPGWRALSRVTGIDVAAAVLDALARS